MTKENWKRKVHISQTPTHGTCEPLIDRGKLEEVRTSTVIIIHCCSTIQVDNSQGIVVSFIDPLEHTSHLQHSTYMYQWGACREQGYSTHSVCVCFVNVHSSSLLYSEASQKRPGITPLAIYIGPVLIIPYSSSPSKQWQTINRGLVCSNIALELGQQEPLTGGLNAGLFSAVKLYNTHTHNINKLASEPQGAAPTKHSAKKQTNSRLSTHHSHSKYSAQSFNIQCRAFWLF